MQAYLCDDVLFIGAPVHTLALNLTLSSDLHVGGIPLVLHGILGSTRNQFRNFLRIKVIRFKGV